jgi:hypothetical protein
MNKKYVTIVLIVSLITNAIQFYLNLRETNVTINGPDVLKETIIQDMKVRQTEIDNRYRLLETIEKSLIQREKKILSDSLSISNHNNHTNEINSINNLDPDAFQRKLNREYLDSDRLDRSGYYWLASGLIR